MDLKELENGVDPQTHWYYQSKKIPLIQWAHGLAKEMGPFSVMDIGAGSGFFSETLIRELPQAVTGATLVDTGFPELISIANNIIRRKDLPEVFHNESLILMDVLEHVESEFDFLQSIYSRRNIHYKHPFFITVPAFQSLWSPHDIYLGHYRRYTAQHLRQSLQRAGWTPTRIYYLYGSLFPVVWLIRRLKSMHLKQNQTTESDMKPLPASINALLLQWEKIEMSFTQRNRWIGITCVAEGYI